MKTLDQSLADVALKYSPGFLELMRFVMPHEVEFQHGHYGDYDFVATEHDPKDPGGTTRYGLDQRSHPHLEIENLTFSQACAEYLRGIWNPLQGDKMEPVVSVTLCDAAINCGNERAIEWMQAVAQAKVDGNLGKNTLNAVNMVEPKIIADGINAARDHYYRVEVRASLRAEYLTGWEDRLKDLEAWDAACPDGGTPDPVAAIA